MIKMNEQPSPTGAWQCGVCFDAFDKDKPIEIGDNTMCRDCGRGLLAERFEAALQNEFEPARWGPTFLDANDFADLLEPVLMQKWNAAKLERDVPLKMRVYRRHKVAGDGVGEIAEKLSVTNLDGPEAPGRSEPAGKEKPETEVLTECGKFIGDRSEAGYPVMVSCIKCQGVVYCSCKAAVTKDQTHDFCNAEASPVADELFSDMKRGKDWQLCPQCGLQVERSDGCNHMTCPSCQEEFCAICGVHAEGDSGHWQRSVSSCPKYNHPDDERGLFEDDSDDDSNDGFVSDAEAMVRRDHPERLFPDIDEFPVTEDMFDATRMSIDLWLVFADLRQQFFTDWLQRLFPGMKDVPTFGEPRPRVSIESLLYCYKIIRMLVEITAPPSDYDVADARARCTNYFVDLGEFRDAIPMDELTDDDSERLDLAVAYCEAVHGVIRRRLDNLEGLDDERDGTWMADLEGIPYPGRSDDDE